MPRLSLVCCCWLLLDIATPSAAKWRPLQQEWVPSTREGALRLAVTRQIDAPVAVDGRLEVFHEGKWGAMCTASWGEAESTVACRQLGFLTGLVLPDGPPPPPTDPSMDPGLVRLSDLHCVGTEARVVDCDGGMEWTVEYVGCDLAGARCTGVPGGSVGDVRLVGGGSAIEGRVEIYGSFGDDVWGSVCDEGWGDEEATVVCRQLGLGAAGSAVTGGAFGGGMYSIVMEGTVCSGSETSLSSCTSNAASICASGRTAGVHCIRGERLVRLVDGKGELDGRVEVMHEGLWGTICDSGWDDVDATVLCKELEFGKGRAVGGAFFGQGEGPVWFDGVGCVPTDESFLSCARGIWSGTACSHAHDAGVECVIILEGSLRLIAGSNPGEGRLEAAPTSHIQCDYMCCQIYHDDEWGTVCDDHWTQANTAVVCRQLGYGHGVVRYDFPGGLGRTWLDEVRCVGTEEMLSQCSHWPWGEFNCRCVPLCPPSPRSLVPALTECGTTMKWWLTAVDSAWIVVRVPPAAHILGRLPPVVMLRLEIAGKVDAEEVLDEVVVLLGITPGNAWIGSYPPPQSDRTQVVLVFPRRLYAQVDEFARKINSAQPRIRLAGREVLSASVDLPTQESFPTAGVVSGIVAGLVAVLLVVGLLVFICCRRRRNASAVSGAHSSRTADDHVMKEAPSPGSLQSPKPEEPQQEEAPQCCVCLTSRPCVLFRPCRHITVCSDCAVDLTTCPLCRRAIESRERVFV